MDRPKTPKDAEAGDPHFQGDTAHGAKISQTLFWWRVVRRVAILYAFVYGSKFIGKIIKHRGFSFLIPAESNVGGL